MSGQTLKDTRTRFGSTKEAFSLAIHNALVEVKGQHSSMCTCHQDEDHLQLGPRSIAHGGRVHQAKPESGTERARVLQTSKTLARTSGVPVV